MGGNCRTRCLSCRGMNRIDLDGQPHTAHRAWQIREQGDVRHQRFEIGRLASGCWYAAKTGRRGTQAWAARDERQACEAVDRWLHRAGQPWREILSAG